MSLLKEGLQSDCDYPVYRKRNVIPILMTHYNSLLTDSSMKVCHGNSIWWINLMSVFLLLVTNIIAHKASKFVKCFCHWSCLE